MVGTIVPMVHGEPNAYKARCLLTLHGLGYIVGACAIGATFAEVGRVSLRFITLARPQQALLCTTIASVICGARELGLISFRTFQFRHQVPRGWRLWPSPIMVSVYGISLGLGVATRIPVSTFHVFLVWCLASARPAWAALAAVGFGAGRMLPLL